MTHDTNPESITRAFEERSEELQQRLQAILSLRTATEAELITAQEAVERLQTRLRGICAKEGSLRSQVADVERALKEARKLLG